MILPILPPTISALSTPPIPTVIVQQGNQQAIAPDWANLSFAQLPPLGGGGSIGGEEWAKGTLVDQILTLCDFQNSLRLQDLNLSAIFQATGTKPETVSLSQFPLVRQQTLSTLVDQIPSLGQETAGAIPPIAKLLRSAKLDSQLQADTPLSLLVKDPNLGNLTFSNLDLSQFSVLDIPGLMQAPLQVFSGWQTARISEVPLLNRYPWNLLPGRLPVGGTIGVVRLLPQPRSQFSSLSSISGSSLTQFQSPCAQSTGCRSIGFSDPSDLQEKQWISSLDQWVEGGDHKVRPLWGSLEPTGRLPYGSAFKVVLTEVTPQSVQTALYFRRCETDAVSGNPICSPYSIGPVNFMTLHHGEAIEVGDIPLSVTEPEPHPIQPMQPEVNPSRSHWQDQMMQWFDEIVPQLKAIVLQWLPSHMKP